MLRRNETQKHPLFPDLSPPWRGGARSIRTARTSRTVGGPGPTVNLHLPSAAFSGLLGMPIAGPLRSEQGTCLASRSLVSCAIRLRSRRSLSVPRINASPITTSTPPNAATQSRQGDGLCDGRNEQTIRCGKDEFVALGDNRESRLDSRYYGAVSRQNILGMLVY